MSPEIYYFSGTGNSLHVAKELQKRIPETKLISIVKPFKKRSYRNQFRYSWIRVSNPSCNGSCSFNGIS